MTKEEFFDCLTEEVKTYKQYIETDSEDWIVKGFIDIDKNVYTITNDTKVISKIIEILLIPKLDKFAHKYGLQLELPSGQNKYPDLTFKDCQGNKFAVDFKSSYYEDETVNGLTLGSYWTYFRDRKNKSGSMDYPYDAYCTHIVLGILYKQSVIDKNECTTYSIDEINIIHSVIEKFIFFVQPKWKIASTTPGSGNTRNIGGITNIKQIINGQGPFAELGEEYFDDYWQGYYNKADANKARIGEPPYNNMETYKEYLRKKADKFNKLK